VITADQLVAHAIGDYILQSDWMANTKTRKSVACLAHVVTYMLPFLFLTRSWKALLFIVATHFVIDRWRLARYVCWAKNNLAPRWLMGMWGTSGKYIATELESMHGALLNLEEPAVRQKVRNYPWEACASTGYPPNRPEWLTVWLLIICDNLMHVLCNAAALRWL